MNNIWEFLLHSELAHFVLAGIALTAISSLEAPTKDSSPTYRFMFRFLNAIALQFKRMFPKIEESPNFQAAVDIQTAKAGLPPIDIQKPAPAEPAAGDAPIALKP